MSIRETKNSVFSSGLIFGIAGFYVLFQFMLQASTSVMVKPLMCDLKINMAQVGFLSSSFFYTYLLLQIPAGLLVDRFGPRKLLSASILVCALACFIFAFANSPLTANASRLLMGLASSPGVVCAMCLACQRFSPKLFPLMAGVVEMLGMLGGAIGESLLAFLVHHLGWRESIGLCALVALLLSYLAWQIIPPTSKDERVCAPSKTPKGLQSIWRDLKKVVTIPQVWIGCLYSGLMFSVVTAFAAMWAVPFLKMTYHAETQQVSWISALLFVGTGIGAPLSGMLAGKSGRFKPWMLGAAFVGLVCICIILYVPHIAKLWMAILFITLGVMSGAYLLPFPLVKKITCESVKGTALGFTNMMCILFGAPILIPLMGVLLHIGQAPLRCVDGLGSHYLLAFSLLPLCLLAALICVFFVKEPD